MEKPRSRKHTPKLGNASEAMVEGEVRTYLRTLSQADIPGKLLEAIAAGDLVTLRAVLLSPPVLLSIPEHIMTEAKTAASIPRFPQQLKPDGLCLFMSEMGLRPARLLQDEKSPAPGFHAASKADLLELWEVLERERSARGRRSVHALR